MSRCKACNNELTVNDLIYDKLMELCTECLNLSEINLYFIEKDESNE